MRMLIQRTTDWVCRVLTLLDKGADDLCDCRADEEADAVDPR